MAEFPTHKRLKDMTDEELQAFRDELQRRATPEEWAAFREFAGIMADFAAVWNSDEAKAARGAASQIFEGLRDFVPILLEELEKEPDAARMDVTELVQSPKWEEIVNRATARLEASGKQKLGDVKTITKNLFSDAYAPMLDGTASNDLLKITTKGKRADSFTGTAVITTASGSKITIEKFDELQGALSVSAHKLLAASLTYLADANFFRSTTSINPTVEIPIIEYGEANGIQLTPRIMDTPEAQAEENRLSDGRIKEFKKALRRDAHDVSSIVWSGEGGKGRKKGDYIEMRLFSAHSIRGNVLRINFDIDAATYFVNAYITQSPVALYRHDNRKPNAYALGRKIAYHNALDQNRAAGTECTLSVKKLLEAAPEIPTLEAIEARGQRNWKDKIKKPLESALDENIRVGLISKWEYRDSSTGETFTAETSKNMTWAQFSALKVDWVMIDAPEQTERREARAEAARLAAIAAETPKKKRGRPRKNRGAIEEQKGGD